MAEQDLNGGQASLLWHQTKVLLEKQTKVETRDGEPYKQKTNNSQQLQQLKPWLLNKYTVFTLQKNLNVKGGNVITDIQKMYIQKKNQ